jgi:hypothetical protein
MSRYIIQICIGFCLLAVLQSCSNGGADWGTYNSADGGFTIEMPTDTKTSEQTLPTPFGKQPVHFVMWKPSSLTIDKFRLFQVSYTSVPPRAFADSFTIQSVLDSSIAMRVKDFADVDMDIYPVTVNGYPGRAFIFDLPENSTIAVVKECLVNHKIYDLTVVLKRNYATNTEVNNFFNSFRVQMR